MFSLIGHLFVAIIYQPFLNILVFFYWLTGWVMQPPNMGIAVIALSIVIRLILLPLSLASDRSEKERRDMVSKLDKLKQKYGAEPVVYEKEKKKLLRSNKRVMLSEFFNLFIQIMVAVMLIRLFKTGLSGADTHLIYSFMPKVAQPFNMEFMGNIDLTESSLLLNFIQSTLIFIFEAFVMLFSAYAVSKRDVVRLQVILPVLTFFAFLFFPAGKKLFVITSLVFSIGLLFSKQIIRVWQRYVLKQREKEGKEEPESIVVSK